MNFLKSLMVVLFSVSVFAGCGQGGTTSVDLSKTLEVIKEEVKTMDVEQIKKTALNYVAEIEKYSPKVEAVADKLKQVPLTKLMGEEAKGYKDEIAMLTKDIQALTARLNIYNEKLKEYGVDISKYVPKK